MTELYIGLMSGTSADGIDAVLIEAHESSVNLLMHRSLSFSAQQRRDILQLCQPGQGEIDLMGQLDRALGLAFAEAANRLLKDCGLRKAQITAIGSHGQTIRHRPPSVSDDYFTLQIADPNIIAEHTGITTVADFRRRDMAAGGEGAPLVPAFHRAVFSHPKQTRVIVNIGGIANVSILNGKNLLAGFDTGPGNVLLDSWIDLQHQQPYDEDGRWASSGIVQPQLLQQLMNHPYFQLPPPKSTGRELFHLSWLKQQLSNYVGVDSADVQATLLEFTASSIHQAIKKEAPNCDGIFICGGGAQNSALMSRLQQLCPAPVKSTAALGIEPQQVEAAAFAWLAQQTLKRRTGNDPSATGASHPVILGGVYFA